MDENIQEMEIPLIPSVPEKKWIKSAYNWGGATILIAFAIMNVVGLIAALIAMILYIMKNGYSQQTILAFQKSISQMNLMMVVINLSGAVVGYPIAFLIGCSGLKIKARNFFSTKGYTLKFVLLAIVVGLGVQLLGSTLADLITRLFEHLGVTLTTIDTSTKPQALTNILMYAFTCLVAPIFEEMIFRGIVFKAFSRISIRFGIIASAALFALYHQNVPQMVNAFLGGLFLAYVAYKTGSIIPTIIIHAALNANGMIWEAVVYLFGENKAGIASNIWAALIAVSAIAILIIYRKKFSLPQNTREKKKRGFPLFITTWTNVTSIIVFVSITILSIKIK